MAEDVTDKIIEIVKRSFEVFEVTLCKGYRLDSRHYYRNAIAVITCRKYGIDPGVARNIVILCGGKYLWYLVDPLGCQKMIITSGDFFQSD